LTTREIHDENKFHFLKQVKAKFCILINFSTAIQVDYKLSWRGNWHIWKEYWRFSRC